MWRKESAEDSRAQHTGTFFQLEGSNCLLPLHSWHRREEDERCWLTTPPGHTKIRLWHFHLHKFNLISGFRNSWDANVSHKAAEGTLSGRLPSQGWFVKHTRVSRATCFQENKTGSLLSHLRGEKPVLEVAGMLQVAGATGFQSTMGSYGLWLLYPIKRILKC